MKGQSSGLKVLRFLKTSRKYDKVTLAVDKARARSSQTLPLVRDS